MKLKQNTLKTGSPKIKLRIYWNVLSGYKIKCNNDVSTGQKLTPLGFFKKTRHNSEIILRSSNKVAASLFLKETPT